MAGKPSDAVSASTLYALRALHVLHGETDLEVPAVTTAVRYQPTIREMPLEERPRERMRDAGPGSLSNGELLAILLRTGSVGENVVQLAGRLLSKYGGLPGLARVGFAELCAEHGMGEAKPWAFLKEKMGWE